MPLGTPAPGDSAATAAVSVCSSRANFVDVAALLTAIVWVLDPAAKLPSSACAASTTQLPGWVKVTTGPCSVQTPVDEASTARVTGFPDAPPVATGV